MGLLERGKEKDTAAGQKRARLICLSGEHQGKTFLITADDYLIGRDAGADLLMSTQPGVSKRHARILTQDGQCSIEDCHSRNGTKVNSVEVEFHPLRDGDIIKICGASFRFISGGGLTTASPKMITWLPKYTAMLYVVGGIAAGGLSAMATFQFIEPVAVGLSPAKTQSSSVEPLEADTADEVEPTRLAQATVGSNAAQLEPIVRDSDSKVGGKVDKPAQAGPARNLSANQAENQTANPAQIEQPSARANAAELNPNRATDGRVELVVKKAIPISRIFRAPIAGKLMWQHVKEGEHVDVGTELATVEGSEHAEEIAELENEKKKLLLEQTTEGVNPRIAVVEAKIRKLEGATMTRETVTAAVSGRLSSFRVGRGVSVKKGQILGTVGTGQTKIVLEDGNISDERAKAITGISWSVGDSEVQAKPLKTEVSNGRLEFTVMISFDERPKKGAALFLQF